MKTTWLLKNLMKFFIIFDFLIYCTVHNTWTCTGSEYNKIKKSSEKVKSIGDVQDFIIKKINMLEMEVKVTKEKLKEKLWI